MYIDIIYLGKYKCKKSIVEHLKRGKDVDGV